jgi:hypothetical protein
MQRCSTLADRDKRLGCFDATMARAPGALVLHPVSALPGDGPAANVSVPPPRARNSGALDSLFGHVPQRRAQTTVAQFGSESIGNGGASAYPIRLDGDTIDQISARVIAADFGGGFITVTLDNGQVWRQTAGADAVGSLGRPAGSYTAVIARGGFAGSYAMRLSGGPGVIAVRRIR